MKKALALAALAASMTAGASAQTAVAPAAPLDPVTFRSMAMASDAFEIESSRLALERSRNPRVRAYAQQMIQDHAMTSQALNGGAAVYGANGQILGGTVTGALAGAGIGAVVGGPVGAAVGAGIGATAGATTGSVAAAAPIQTAVPLDAQKAAMLNNLAATSGPRFDRLYGQYQRMGHREAIGLYTAYLQTGSDPALRNFAQQTLPHLQMHYAESRRLPGGGR